MLWVSNDMIFILGLSNDMIFILGLSNDMIFILGLSNDMIFILGLSNDMIFILGLSNDMIFILGELSLCFNGHNCSLQICEMRDAELCMEMTVQRKHCSSSAVDDLFLLIIKVYDLRLSWFALTWS